MAVQGVFMSDAHIVGARVGDFASTLLQLNPTGTAPLFALSSGMDNAMAQDVMVTWFEENHLSGRKAVASFSTDGDGTGFVMTENVDDWIPGVILLNEERGEYLLVTAVNTSTKTITLTRNIDGSGAVTVQVGDHFQRTGTAYEEASSKPTAVVNLGYPVFNYMQIFRNTWNVSGTAQAVAYRVASPAAKNRADCALFHAEDIERAFLWGTLSLGTLNSRPFRTANGIYNMITTNVTAAGATTTFAQLDNVFKTTFSKNVKGKPNERIGFTGNLGIQVINQIARLQAMSNLTLNVGQTDFGMEIYTWRTPYGTIRFMTHPLFTESSFRSGDLLILHPGTTRIRYLRKTLIDQYDQNGRRAGDDADYGVYTTEASFEYRAEVTGYVYTGMQAGAA